MTEQELQEGTRINKQIQEYEKLAEAFKNAYREHPKRFRNPLLFLGRNKKDEVLSFFQGIELEPRTAVTLDKELTDLIADYYEKKVEKLKEEFSLLGKRMRY